MELDYSSTGAEDLAEFAGRACYQSFHKPNALTRYNDAYLANILVQGHESVLEHASVSFYVQGVSRNMLLELERHRHLSFSVISTRFVNSEHTEVVIPPALRGDALAEYVIIEQAEASRKAYVALYERLTLAGKTRKEGREAARVALSGNLETKFVVTGNMRAWRDVLKKRYSVHADAEIDSSLKVCYSCFVRKPRTSSRTSLRPRSSERSVDDIRRAYSGGSCQLWQFDQRQG